MISTIELFPNEVFIELFEYLSSYDVYKTFYNINQRLNSIINSLQNLYLISNEDWDNKPDVIPPFFVSQLSTLIIKHDELIDFFYYSNIRSLKLSMPTRNQCDSIQPSVLPNLEHLYISNYFYADNSERLCQKIFSSEFSHLKTCQIDRITLNQSYPYLTLTLRQLTLSPSTWKINLYKQIFQACPKLTHLKLIRLRNLNFKLLKNLSYQHTSLRCLSMQFDSIGKDWYEQINWLLAAVPNLEYYRLFIAKNDMNIEFPLELFAHLLTKHLPCLINFKAKIPSNRLLSKDLNVIKCLHRLFIHVQYQEYMNQDFNNYLMISSE